MGGAGEAERVMAECESCESVYAARQWSDGRVQPIGCDRCRCGTTDFRVLDVELTEDSVT